MAFGEVLGNEEIDAVAISTPKVLWVSQLSLENNGMVVAIEKVEAKKYFAHPTTIIDTPCEIGEGTKVKKGATIGANATITVE